MTLHGDNMDAESADWWHQWRPASGHPSGLWRVCRENFLQHRRPMGPGLEEHSNKLGRPILFRSYEAAQRRADKLNREESST